MEPSAPTIRTLARDLGLSPTTVSESLRGVARVRPATAKRVRTAAAAAGYRPNQLAARVMSQLRKGTVDRFQGTLAILDLDDKDRLEGANRYHARLIAGATSRAHELGFSIDRFQVGPETLPPSRLRGILDNRQIGGVIVLPSFAGVHLEDLDWSHLAGLYLDRVVCHPPLHSVSPDYFGGMFVALRELAARGYQRPGLVVRKAQDRRLRSRWTGAFLANCLPDPQIDPAPPLLVDLQDRSSIVDWFNTHKPDVLIGHQTNLLRILEEAGSGRSPGCGFVSLNADLVEHDCAAIDLQPYQIGARGAELLIGQMLRGESGLTEEPCNTSVPAVWREGSTIRAIMT